MSSCSGAIGVRSPYIGARWRALRSTFIASDAMEFNKSRIAKHHTVFKTVKLLAQILPRDRRLWKCPSAKVVVAWYHQYFDMFRNLCQQLGSMTHLFCRVYFQQFFVLVWKYTNAVD